MNSLPNVYQVVKNVLQYIGTVSKFDFIVSGIKARELELNASKRNGSNFLIQINLVVMDKKIRKRVNLKQVNGSVITVGKWSHKEVLL